MHDRATTQRTAVQSAKGRLLRKVISSNECTGAQRIDESGAPSARIPGRGFEVAPTLGPPIKGTAAEDAQSCTSARTILAACFKFLQPKVIEGKKIDCALADPHLPRLLGGAPQLFTTNLVFFSQTIEW